MASCCPRGIGFRHPRVAPSFRIIRWSLFTYSAEMEAPRVYYRPRRVQDKFRKESIPRAFVRTATHTPDLLEAEVYGSDRPDMRRASSTRFTTGCSGIGQVWRVGRTRRRRLMEVPKTPHAAPYQDTSSRRRVTLVSLSKMPNTPLVSCKPS
jgi:hypothetical protein